MRFYHRTGKSHEAHDSRVPSEAIQRSAPVRHKALCAGVDRFVARMTGALPAPPQPHVWWPVGRRGQLCLRCSAYERGA